ncbi:MAG: hypothetical protein V3U53_02720 [bacterium]
MSRVRLLDPENSDGEIARTFRMLARVQRRFVNSTRATAHSPFLARIFIMLVQTLMREGLGTVLSSKLKEMAVIKTSQLNGCEY